jgi:hypothetical protein
MLYNEIQEELHKLEQIDNWNDKIDKIKELKQIIDNELNKMDELSNKIINDTYIDISNYDLNINDLINLLQNNEENNLEEKVNYYCILNNYINQLNNNLFN